MRFLLACLSFLAQDAWASPFYSKVPVQFYSVQTPLAMPFLETKRAVRHVQGYYRKWFQIDLKITKFKRQHDVFNPKINYLSYALARFYAWYNWSEGRRHYGQITQVITGPLLSESDWYTAGLGYIGCAKTTNLLNFSIAYTTLYSLDKHSRFVNAKAAIAHELGHNLGAHHTPDCSLMDTNLNYCLGNNARRIARPSQISIKEIRKCTMTTGRQESFIESAKSITH